MIHFQKISDFHDAFGVPPPDHPLLSLLDGDKKSSCGKEITFTSDFYMISLKK